VRIGGGLEPEVTAMAITAPITAAPTPAQTSGLLHSWQPDGGRSHRMSAQ
jgi:hypothetical protein